MYYVQCMNLVEIPYSPFNAHVNSAEYAHSSPMLLLVSLQTFTQPWAISCLYYPHISYMTTYSLWSAMHELSLVLNYQVYR